MGAIRGIPTDDFSGVKVTLKDHEDAVITTASISTVTPDRSFLALDDDSKVDIKDSYSGEITGLFRNPVAVYLDASTDADAMGKLQAAFDKEGAKLSEENNIKLVDNFSGSDYLISVQKEHYVISRTSDKKNRPIVEQQPVTNEKAIEQVVYFIKAISRYDFNMALDNPKTNLKAGDPSKPPAGVEIYRVHDENDRSKDELIPAVDGVVEVEDGDLISIKTVNNTRRNKLFFALLSDATAGDGVFGLNGSSLGDSAQEMLPNEELWYDEMAAFEAFPADYILDFGFPDYRMRFKLIASTETFSARDLSQDPLPYPFLYDKGDDVGSRGLKRRSRPDSADWCVYDLDIVIKNPDGEE
jgi:hypothetical protein